MQRPGGSKWRQGSRAEEKQEWQRGEAEEAELQRIESDAVEAFEADVVNEFQGADTHRFWPTKHKN